MSGKDKQSRTAGKPNEGLKAIIALAALAVAVVALYVLQEQLLASSSAAQRPARVVVADLARHLPEDIARTVVDSVQASVVGGSVFDRGLARAVYDAAKAEPWIACVRRVSKAPDGTVLVEADVRQPFALVRSACLPVDRPVVLDAEGVVLPLDPARVRSDSVLTVIEAAGRPPDPGVKWTATDVVDGLKLVELLRPRPYAGQISIVDVRNHNGRIDPREPHLRIWAQLGRGPKTDVRFGRFPENDLDYCISPEQKMKWLDGIVAKYDGRLAGVRNYIELRYDEPYESLN